MLKKKVCFLTTVFPMPVEYLHSFFYSLEQQDCKGFDVVIVNDGNQDLDMVLESYGSLNTIILKAGSDPIHNRELLIEFALINNYEIAIFGDSDDEFSANRISLVTTKLKKNDIVVNDLSSFNQQGILENYYISNRIINNSDILFEDILNFNIFGLSNTGVNCTILKSLTLPFDKRLIALDWFIFSVLLLNNYRAIFTNECVTYYRQHERNIAGIGAINVNSVNRSILVKSKHFSAMAELYDGATKLKKEVNKLQGNNERLKQLIIDLQKNNKYPLWWEL